MNIIPIDWYIESPIDFEHKQYILFAYLQKVDFDFHKKTLSPHLLHLERVHDELSNFEKSFSSIKEDFDKNRYIFFDNEKLSGEDNSLIYEIKSIVEFAIPQIEPRIKLGYQILKRYNQVLY